MAGPEAMRLELVETHKFSTLASRTARQRWFGRSVARFTRGAKSVDYADAAVRQLIEPHVRKMRLRRGPVYGGARKAFVFDYDAVEFPLAQTFADALGVDVQDLCRLHALRALADADAGDVAKRALLGPLLGAAARRSFEATFEKWVLTCALPALFPGGAVGCVRYQRFPCVRVQLPGELTIGPHVDAAYGHAAA
ncbi:hypothetical protein M885DRAFT_611031, partial [Pelagophyceae sp. CCMP2097]